MRTIYKSGIISAKRVLATRVPSHNDLWTRGDRSYYSQGWDLQGKSTFTLPNLSNRNVIRYQSQGNKVERID